MRFNSAALLFTIILVGFALYSKAQQPVFRNYSVAQGLPSSETYRVLQDRKGYIWIATDGGVARFDGNNFKTYTTKDGLCDNTILHLFEDPKGRIWFYSFAGKFSYFNNDSIFNLPINDTYLHNVLKSNAINAMYIDSNDTLWMYDRYYSIYKLHIKDKLYTRTLKERNILHLKELEKNTLLFGLSPLPKLKITTLRREFSNGQIQEYNISKLKLTYEEIASTPGFISIKLKDNSILFGINKQLLRIKDKQLVEHVFVNDRIFALYQDKKGDVWVGQRGFGAWCYKASSDHYLSQKPKIYLPYKSVSSILQDTEGAYWFSTLESGLYYTPSLHFISYILNDAKHDYKVVDLCDYTKKSCLFVTYDRQLYEIKNDSLIQRKIREAKSHIILNGVTYKDQNSSLWFSVYNSTMKRGSFLNTSATLKVLKEYSVGSPSAFFQDKNEFWFGAHGLGVILLNSNKLINYDRGYHQFAENLRIGAICKRDGLVYIGSTNGLWTFDGRNYVYLGAKEPLFKTRINAIKKDVKNNLWVASKGSGILVYTPDQKIYQISEQQGLANDQCNAIVIDSNNIVWVSSNNGLSKIVKADFVNKRFLIQNYNSTHGLISNQVNQMFVKDSSIWMAANQGITRFNTKEALANIVPPPIYLDNISINNQKSVLEKEYVLPYNKNTLELDYVGLAYKNAGKIKYKYRLEGLDTNWVYTYNTSVRFADLSPGKYVFKVLAANNDGYWSATPATIKIHIKPPFWLTWWFITLSILALTGSVFLVVRRRIKIIENRELQKTKDNIRVANLELKALKARMNPHFLFNTLNSIQQYVAKNNPEKAYNYFSKCTQLMRKVFDYSAEQSINIEEELDTLRLYLDLESLRFENRFTYDICVDDDIDLVFEKIPPLLIQPYIENAIWHGLKNKTTNDGMLSISISKQNANTLKCVVEDNGVGRAETMRLKSKNITSHKSGGMDVTKERLQLLNTIAGNNFSLKITDLIDFEEKACGTRVELFIPIQ